MSRCYLSQHKPLFVPDYILMYSLSELPYFPLPSGSRACGVNMTYEQSVRLSLARAKEITCAGDLTVEDIERTSRKFSDLQIDPIKLVDGAAARFFTFQTNLAAGTICVYLKTQPYLRQTVEDILRFEVQPVPDSLCRTVLDFV
ncbi:unnamed protein product [Mycena citricolor]|uniref:Uncharacterized protein n=1 Tax=Mycena citricolor TaxID=2018698 RepID=A0AAD2K0V6_9AGAR|nr:unnamed protein product [Mycena citricolor]CAK5271796.1 unnamed protein product [Mycena citricolor]